MVATLDLPEKLSLLTDAVAHDERRVTKRYRANIPARCYIPGHDPIDAVIVDISKGGFGLNKPLPIARGEHLRIVLLGVDAYDAVIAWNGSDKCGLQLLPGAGEISSAATDDLASALTDMIGEKR